MVEHLIESNRELVIDFGRQLDNNLISLTEFMYGEKPSDFRSQLRKTLLDHLGLKVPPIQDYSNRPIYLMNELGINPKITTFVDNPTHYAEETTRLLFTEGYNSQWYFLIKGKEFDEKTHLSGENYFWRNILAVKHNSNPEYAKMFLNRYTSPQEL